MPEYTNECQNIIKNLKYTKQQKVMKEQIKYKFSRRYHKLY